jgi:ribosomal protein L11 methyltransferase
VGRYLFCDLVRVGILYTSDLPCSSAHATKLGSAGQSLDLEWVGTSTLTPDMTGRHFAVYAPGMSRHHPSLLETVSVTVPEAATEAYEAAFASACASVGFFRNHATGDWRIEGVKEVAAGDSSLTAALALAERLTGVAATLERRQTPADGWLARTQASFPEQCIGRRFAIRGTHLTGPPTPGRITLTLDAGLAFGSGEHGSTRGCLRALEGVAHRHPRRILDMGTGSGVLAMGAARLLRRRVLATDIEPWSVRVAEQNARLNRLSHLIRVRLADGWRSVAVRRRGSFDLVLANILARPLCAMANDLGANLAPDGTAILSGLLATQARWVLAVHRRRGLRLERRLTEGVWTTLVLRR